MIDYEKYDYKDLLENVICNLCGSNDYTVIYPPRYELAQTDKIIHTFRSSGDEFLYDQLVKCKKCGLKYLSPRLKENIILEAYSSGTDEIFISQVKAREKAFEKKIKIIEKFYPNKGKLIDVGTAGGSFPAVAKKRGWDVYACEPNHWLAEWGSKYYGINIHAGTIFTMGLKDSSFDVVTLFDVLEHTPDPKKVLLECNRILKPDGLIIISYPDIGSSIARIMRRKWVFLLSVHLYYFTSDTIKKMLEITGFELINKKRYWQTLELGYIFFRMKPYIKFLAEVGNKFITFLKMQNLHIPYWMGQMMVIAKRR